MLTLAAYFPHVLRTSFNAGVFAPAQSQAIQVVKKRLREQFFKIKPHLERYNLTLDTGDSYFSELFAMQDHTTLNYGMIRCLSAGKQSNVTGETLQLLVCEQSEDIDPLKLTEEIFPMLAATGGVAVLTGTCKARVRNTYFYDGLTKKDHDPLNYFIVDYKEAMKYNPKYRNHIKKTIERLPGGIDDIAFRTQYALEWVGGAGKFIQREDLFALSRKEPYKLPVDDDGYLLLPMRAGWDVAKSIDQSVVTLGVSDMEFAHIVHWLRMEGVDYPRQCRDVANLLNETGVEQISVDATGVGDPIVEFLEEALGDLDRYDINVIPVTLESSLKVHDQLSKLMSRVFQDSRIDYPSVREAQILGQIRERREFIDQFLDLETTWRQGKMKLVHPEGDRYHDDYPYSTMLMLHACMLPPPKIIMRSF